MKRHLFTELTEGLAALSDEREGKRSLRSSMLEAKSDVQVSAQQVKMVREGLKLSQPVFAHRLRIGRRTLQNWEQGRTKPNAQGRLFIKLMERFPDTAKRLQAL